MISLPRFDVKDPALDTLRKRQKIFSPHNEKTYAQLFSASFNLDIENVSAKNCENLIGSVEIPVGLAGPLLANTTQETHGYIIPLATTEGALVASVNRGCKAITQSGGVSIQVEKRGMTRAPVFQCQSGTEATTLTKWLDQNQGKLQHLVQQTSSHLTFLSLTHWVRGRYVYVRFVFDTDQAMGMNMVTIATEKIARWITKENPNIALIALSSNVCTDKKDSLINALYGRGYWVQAEANISETIISSVLKTTSDAILAVHVAKNLVGSNIAGSFSQNAQVGNVLAALYIATGQDPAHVIDGSRAFLTIEKEKNGLYIALTLPSIIVGVIGGGTYLSAQAQARDIIKHDGSLLKAEELAGVVGGASLAGEISLLAALASQDLAKAHQHLGRQK